MSFLQRCCAFIDGLSSRLGRLCAWLTLAMLLLAVLVVGLRYGFAIGSIALQESVLYLHGAMLTLGAGFTLLHDGHVRVDILYRDWPPRRRAWIDLFGTLTLLLPLLAYTSWSSWRYVAVSWARWEASPEAGGLAMVYLQKSFILVLVLSLGLQALAFALRQWLFLKGRPSA